MKGLIVFLSLAVVATLAHPHKGSKVHSVNDVVDDIKVLLAKMKLDDIVPPTRDRLCTENDVKTLMTYAKSDDFHTREGELLGNPDVQKLISLLMGSGVDLNPFVNFLSGIFSCPASSSKLGGDPEDLTKDLAQVKLEQAFPLYHDRLLKEDQIGKLLNLITSGEGLTDVTNILASQAVTDVKTDLTNLGADGQRILDLVKTFIGL